MNDSSSSEVPQNALSGDELRAAVKSVLRILVREGQSRLNGAIEDGRTALNVRSLQRDRQKMYEKLGREVVRLVEAGEISHPGLLKGVERIKMLEDEIVQAQESSTEKNIDAAHEHE